MTHRTEEYDEFEEEVLTQEEFEQCSEEWKARGPFTAQPEVTTWIDFMGHERNRTHFGVFDSAGVRVGIAADQLQALRWARELTENGYIED
jgi:hypothetical protein